MRVIWFCTVSLINVCFCVFVNCFLCVSTFLPSILHQSLVLHLLSFTRPWRMASCELHKSTATEQVHTSGWERVTEVKWMYRGHRKQLKTSFSKCSFAGISPVSDSKGWADVEDPTQVALPPRRPLPGGPCHTEARELNRRTVRGFFLGPLVKGGDTIRALITTVWSIPSGSSPLHSYSAL